MANMGSRIAGQLIVALHGANAPTGPEWEAHLALLGSAARAARGSLEPYRCLVVSDGGMPDSAQRQASTRVIDAANGSRMPVAIVTTSTLVRGIVTAGHWFGLRMQAFAPAELAAASSYLEIEPADLVTLRRELDLLATAVPCRTYAQLVW